MLLFVYACESAMAGNDRRAIVQSEQATANAFQYGLGISARQIRAADPSGEQSIAGKNQTFYGKAAGTRSMARCVQHMQPVVAHRKFHTIFQIQIDGFLCIHGRQSEPSALHAKVTI